jgi:alkylresorcinol/alkylpyrone synthase
LTHSLKIAGIGRAFPPHYYDQATVLGALQKAWSEQHFNPKRLESLHKHVLVGGRYLSLPIEEYERLDGWGEANDAWIRVAQDVGEQAVRDALSASGITTDDVDALVFVTVTGVSTPSIDARLMNRLALPQRVTRIPIFGLGCLAGAAGIARAADYVRAYPDRTAVLLSVELCSLTVQRQDLSIPNLIATGLFGDGAAAAVIVGDGRETTGPEIVASRSVFYPDSEDVMGWGISEQGFRVVLSADVPQVVMEFIARDVDAFLGDHRLRRSDISRWVSHPGGPKVLTAMQQALELPDDALELSWHTLKTLGNLSSTSVLLVLQETMESRPPEPGSYGLMMAMGPGFCSELVLLRW